MRESSATARTSWLGFTVMCVGMFMAILDIQIVAAALPRIATALQTPLDRLSWIQTAYLITEVLAIALSGRLARGLSTRWLFTIAALGFVASSLGCAASQTFESLIFWRALQGFFGGTIIPTVFASGYKMFPRALHARAILIAGGLAMLAPSIGPFIGGLLAERLSWHWLFLINVPIGLLVAAVVFVQVDIDRADRSAWATIDGLAFVALAISLAALEIVLKVAPADHWVAPRDAGLIGLTVVGGVVLIRRCIGTREALIDFSPLRERGYAIACVYNFVLGVGLFGAIYALPLFLGFVRFHTPLEIGTIMTVMGAAQLIVAPLATLAERRFPAAWVAFFGFALFAAGSFANAFQTPTTDFAGLVVPQLLRGVALLFCVLPITNVALDQLPDDALSNASGLLNLVRSIGGAIGIGLIDTVINVRPARIATELFDQLTRGNAAVARFVGLPRDVLAGATLATADPGDIAFIKPIVARAAATIAFNEAWILIGSIFAASLLIAPLLHRRTRTQSPDPLAPHERPIVHATPSLHP